MAVSQVSIQTPWGRISTVSFGEVRSYDAEGKAFYFVPTTRGDWHYAMDVETRADTGGTLVAQALETCDLPPWVAIEVVAKLTNTPAHLVFQSVRRAGLSKVLSRSEIELAQFHTTEHWIAVGRRETKGSGSNKRRERRLLK